MWSSSPHSPKRMCSPTRAKTHNPKSTHNPMAVVSTPTMRATTPSPTRARAHNPTTPIVPMADHSNKPTADPMAHDSHKVVGSSVVQ